MTDNPTRDALADLAVALHQIADLVKDMEDHEERLREIEASKGKILDRIATVGLGAIAGYIATMLSGK